MNPPINCLQAQNSISHAAIAINAVSKASYTFGPITMDGSSLVLSRKAQTFNSEKH
jgi:predicted metal-binding protein